MGLFAGIEEEEEKKDKKESPPLPRAYVSLLCWLEEPLPHQLVQVHVRHAPPTCTPPTLSSKYSRTVYLQSGVRTQHHPKLQWLWQWFLVGQSAGLP